MIKIFRLRNILIVVFLFANAIVFSQNTNNKKYKEYLEVRVTYNSKNNKVVSNLTINTGESFPNSLRGLIENGETNDFIRVLKYNGLVLIIRNEVDIINYLSSIGWELHSINKITVMSKDYIKYIFVTKE